MKKNIKLIVFIEESHKQLIEKTMKERGGSKADAVRYLLSKNIRSTDDEHVKEHIQEHKHVEVNLPVYVKEHKHIQVDVPEHVDNRKTQSTESKEITIKKLSDWDEGKDHGERRLFVRRASKGIYEIFGKMTPLWNESRLREYCNRKDASDDPYDENAKALLRLFNEVANMSPQEEEGEAE